MKFFFEEESEISSGPQITILGPPRPHVPRGPSPSIPTSLKYYLGAIIRGSRVRAPGPTEKRRGKILAPPRRFKGKQPVELKSPVSGGAGPPVDHGAGRDG